jgi:hypothetical protein
MKSLLLVGFAAALAVVGCGARSASESSSSAESAATPVCHEACVLGSHCQDGACVADAPKVCHEACVFGAHCVEGACVADAVPCAFPDGATMGICDPDFACLWGGNCDPGPDGSPPECGMICVDCANPANPHQRAVCAANGG